MEAPRPPRAWARFDSSSSNVLCPALPLAPRVPTLLPPYYPWQPPLSPLTPPPSAPRGRYMLSEPDDDVIELDLWSALVDASTEVSNAVTATLTERNLMERAQQKAAQLASDAAKLAQSQQAKGFAQGSLSLLGGGVQLVTSLCASVLRSVQSALYILVFASFALSFLSMQHDPLRSANDTAESLLRVSLPAHKLQSLRHAFWAASVLPITVAARHAVLCLLLFWACRTPMPTGAQPTRNPRATHARAPMLALTCTMVAWHS